MNSTMLKNRIFYLDLLRVLSILGVIVIHIVSTALLENAIGSTSWWWANFFSALTRWAVPLFFMISGVLTLQNEKVDYPSSFIKSRMVKIGIPFLIWSIIYSIIKQTYIVGAPIIFPDILRIILGNIIFDQSYYHLWFVYDIFILYLISPFLRKIVLHATDKDLKYLLGLWFASSILYLSIQQIIPLINPALPTYIHILNIPFVFGLSGYYILGYYLNQHTFSKKVKILLYTCAPIAFLMTAFGTYFLSTHQGSLNESLYNHFSLPTFIISVALFIFVKDIDWTKHLTESFKHFLGLISNSTFGIYLIHIIVLINVTNHLSPLLKLSYPLYVLCLTFVTFMFSFFFVKLIRLIPVIGKYLI